MYSYFHFFALTSHLNTFPVSNLHRFILPFFVHIKQNFPNIFFLQVNKKAPMVALCWLNWVLKHKFDKATRNACLPRVATSSLTSLEEHRTMITEKLLADLFAAKLRALYAQVFYCSFFIFYFRVLLCLRTQS